MTRDSLEGYGFQEGNTVTALVKAVNVALGK
jgi:molybdopterin-binding protein